MGSDFARLAVLNRGAAAIRCINAVAEYNHERDTAIRTIAVFADADRAALFVREADEAICVPAGALRARPRSRAAARTVPTPSTSTCSCARCASTASTRSGSDGVASPSTPCSRADATSSGSR